MPTDSWISYRLFWVPARDLGALSITALNTAALSGLALFSSLSAPAHAQQTIVGPGQTYIHDDGTPFVAGTTTNNTHAVLVNSGSFLVEGSAVDISTSGTGASGLRLEAASGPATAVIRGTAAGAAIAVSADGTDAVSLAGSAGNLASIDLDSVKVIANGDLNASFRTGSGVYLEGSSQAVLRNVDITTLRGAGVFLNRLSGPVAGQQDQSASLTNFVIRAGLDASSGTPSVEGALGGVVAINPGRVELANGDVETWGESTTGVSMTNSVPRVRMDRLFATNVDVTTHGEEGRGYSLGLSAQIKGGSIQTFGRGATAVYVNDFGTTLPIVRIDGTWIATYGDEADAIWSAANATVDIRNASITTAGSGALGVRNFGVGITIMDSWIATSGAQAHAVSLSQSAEATISGSTLHTSGVGAAGVRIFGLGGSNRAILDGSVVVADKGPALFATGSGSAVFDLRNSRVTANGGSGLLLNTETGSLTDTATINATNSTLLGDMEVGNRQIAVRLADRSLFTGAMLSSGVGIVNQVDIDNTSRWNVRANSTVEAIDSSGFLLVPTGITLKTTAGATIAQGGTLRVDGIMAGEVSVQSGGLLSGTGTVGNTANSGTVASGLDTLRFSGTLAMNAGSIYQVEINPAGQSGKLTVAGAASIDGGTVQVLAGGAGVFAPSTTYTILSAAGGRNGAFSQATSNLAFLDPSLSYDPNNVYLTMVRNDTGFSLVGRTRNQVATGAAVESTGFGNPVYDAVLGLEAGQARAAFDQLSGEVHASAKTALIEDSHFVRDAANDRIRAAFGDWTAAPMRVAAYTEGRPVQVAPTAERLVVWSQGFGDWGRADSDGNAARMTQSTGGVLVGTDVPLPGNWRVGGLLGYSHTSFDVDDRGASGSSDNYHLGLYGGTQRGPFGFRSGAAYTWHDISTRRSAVFPGFGDRLEGDYDAGTFQAFGEFGYRIETAAAVFQPYANLAYVHLDTGSFREQGGAAALRANSQSTQTTFSTLGLRASTNFAIGKVNTTARGMLGWRHAFGDITPQSTQAFAAGNAYTVAGVPIAKDSAVLEAGLDLDLTPLTTLGVSYQGQFAGDTRQDGFKANLAIKF